MNSVHNYRRAHPDVNRARRSSSAPAVSALAPPTQSLICTPASRRLIHFHLASCRGKPIGECFAYLRKIGILVLVVGGKSDIIFYTINAFYLRQNLPNAQLIVYPDAAYGSLFQYPGLFVEHASMFLRG